ncbi:MAG: hypothetical protein Q9209_001530 [Squamulea sp. 1 TL-2023]
MASKTITYVWKIPRPIDDVAARALMAAAYQIATKTDPHVTTVLVRSPIRATTWKNGKWVRDDPHLTICSKNSSQEQQKIHEAAHNYTKSMQDTTLLRVTPSGFTKADNTKDRRGKEIWPNGLPSEIIMHRGPEP